MSLKSLKKDGAELILENLLENSTKDVKNLGKTPAGRAFLNSYDEVSREFGSQVLWALLQSAVFIKKS